jgi:tetratricopeptide (TPR) repeat protein
MKILLLLPFLILGLWGQETQPQDPQELPVCKDLSGENVDWAQFDKQSIILFFHKPGLDYSTQGLQGLIEKLSATSEKKVPAALVVVGFEDSDLEAASEALQQAGISGTVILDRNRSAFGSYHVKAYPTAHILDDQHHEVAVARGFGPHFVFRVHLAARYGAGQIELDEYQSLLAGGAKSEHDERLVKLHRNVGLARRLALGGKPAQALALLEAALQKAQGVPLDTEVLELATRLNLLEGKVERAAEHLAELCTHFPDATAIPFLQCRMALAEGDLEAAAKAIKGKRARLQPEAVLLRGLILEAQDKCEKAAELYRKELEKQALKGV